MPNQPFSFQCTGEDGPEIGEELAKQLDLHFPEAYLSHESMEKMALAVKQARNASFCVLPFCHTVEGEAFGGKINYGNALIGPRAKERTCGAAEEVLALCPIDFSSGRIAEVLTACRNLSRQGESVVLNMSGPLTILNVLMETSDVFSILMDSSAAADAVFQMLGKELLRYTEEAAEAGVSLISFADPIGGADILGPAMAQSFARRFTLPFLRSVDRLLAEKKRTAAPGRKTTLFLCPKACQALSDTGAVHWDKLPAPTNPTVTADLALNPTGMAQLPAQTHTLRNICQRIPERDSIIGGACIKPLLCGSASVPCYAMKWTDSSAGPSRD